LLLSLEVILTTILYISYSLLRSSRSARVHEHCNHFRFSFADKTHFCKL